VKSPNRRVRALQEIIRQPAGYGEISSLCRNRLIRRVLASIAEPHTTQVGRTRRPPPAYPIPLWILNCKGGMLFAQALDGNHEIRVRSSLSIAAESLKNVFIAS